MRRREPRSGPRALPVVLLTALLTVALALLGPVVAACSSSGAGATGGSGLPTVAVDDLPTEARDTLDTIDAGGPFPYEQDGVTFYNREGLLPDQPTGYYREYTVVTPGEGDRGARRIVTGRDGERYWTADHYASFAEIIGDGTTSQGAG